MTGSRLCALSALAAFSVASAAMAHPVALSAQGRAVMAMARAGDAAGEPFMIVDKRQARVFIFTGAGAMVGDEPVLLGSAIGDDSAPGDGDRPVARIPPAERTTPAGRFSAAFGQNTHGQSVLWVDYRDAIALHSVDQTDPKEHRRQRLATVSLTDKRMSYGCINVSARVFDTLVVDLFSKQRGVVYVLPEVRPLGDVFAALAGAGGDVAAGS